MSDSKNKIMSGILVLITIFLLTALVYFVLQNNKLEKEIKKIDNMTTNATSTTTSNLYKQPLIVRNLGTLIGDVELLKQNFKSIIRQQDNNYYNLNLEYSCSYYDEELQRCLDANLLIDSKIKSGTDLNTCGTLDIIKNDKYYILESNNACVLQFSVLVYDINGNQLYKENNGTKFLGNPYIENGIYYYKTFEEIDDNYDKLYSKSINLNDSNISSKVINTITIGKLPQTS